MPAAPLLLFLLLAGLRAPAPGGDELTPRYGGTPPELAPYREAQAYRYFFLTPPVYRGPSREHAVPDGLETVRIGLIAPLQGTPDDAAGQDLQRGVQLALEEANAAGGFRGLPFELISRNDQAIWGSSANTLVELSYEQGVWAVIGSVDSNSTHVALRVALKCEVPIVNVGSNDPTVTETGIPWIVRCTPDDRQTSYRLAQLVFQERGLARVAVIRSSDRYGRLGVKEFLDAARRLGQPLPMELLFAPGQADFDSELERLRKSGAEAVVLWSKARDAGRIVRRMRELGLAQPVFGPPRLVSREFLEAAGDAAEGTLAAAWLDPGSRADAAWRAFVERFRARFEREPDVFAAYGYDATRLVVDRLRAVGLNKALLRDALTELREHHGLTGDMRLDATSNNLAPLYLVRAEGGRFVAR